MKDLQTIVSPYRGDPNALFEMLCTNIQEDSLAWISEADYGMEAEERLMGLRKIKQDKAIYAMDWGLQEVLELTRWQQPERTSDKWMTEAQKKNMHIAFSCAALLTVPGSQYSRLEENSAIIRLVETSEYLEQVLPGMLRGTSHVLAWRVAQSDTDEEEVPFFLLGLILTVLKCGEYGDSSMIQLIDQLLRAEQALHEQGIGPYDVTDWLFRNTHFNQLQGAWQSYELFLREHSEKTKSVDLSAKLKELADLLKGGN